MADTTENGKEPDPKPRKKLKSAKGEEETKEKAKAEEETKEKAKAEEQAKVDEKDNTLKYDIHISDNDKSTYDPAPVPVWYQGIDWGTRWCVQISPNHPGHPKNVNQTAKKNFGVTRRPLVGYIRGTSTTIKNNPKWWTSMKYMTS